MIAFVGGHFRFLSTMMPREVIMSLPYITMDLGQISTYPGLNADLKSCQDISPCSFDSLYAANTQGLYLFTSAWFAAIVAFDEPFPFRMYCPKFGGPNVPSQLSGPL